jgi:hypothetical protein
MRAKQRGITVLGWLIILVPIAIVGYSIIRLTPIYLNYMKVVQALEQTASSLKSDEGLSRQAIVTSLGKQFDINSLDFPKLNDIEVQRVDGRWTMEASYEDVAPLFFDLSILVKFDKTVQIGS